MIYVKPVLQVYNDEELADIIVGAASCGEICNINCACGGVKQ